MGRPDKIRTALLDASALIGVIKGEPEFACLKSLLAAVDRREITLVESTAILAEVQPEHKTDPSRHARDTVRALLESPATQLIDVSTASAREAGELRVKHGLTTWDAVHLATAILGSVDVLIVRVHGVGGVGCLCEWGSSTARSAAERTARYRSGSRVSVVVDFAHTARAEQARHRKARILARWCYQRGVLAGVVRCSRRCCGSLPTRRGCGPRTRTPVAARRPGSRSTRSLPPGGTGTGGMGCGPHLGWSTWRRRSRRWLRVRLCRAATVGRCRRKTSVDVSQRIWVGSISTNTAA